jgi:hypothetical protein
MPRSGSSSVKSGSSKSARNRRLKDKLNELKQKMDQVRSLWQKFDSHFCKALLKKYSSKLCRTGKLRSFCRIIVTTWTPCSEPWISLKDY